MRKLNSTDIYPMTKVIAKLGLKDVVSQLDPEALKELVDTTDTGEEDGSYQVGMSLIVSIASIMIGNLSNAENEINTFLSRVSEKSVDELKEMDPGEYIDILGEVLYSDEFAGFIKAVSKLLKFMK